MNDNEMKRITEKKKTKEIKRRKQTNIHAIG